MQQVVIDPVAGHEWLEKSLAQGFDISTAVLASASFNEGRFRSFLDSDKSPRANFAEGGVAETDKSREALARYLDCLSSGRASCLILEDDLRRRTDPLVGSRPGSSISFIGDRLVHWCDRGQAPDSDCVDVITRGASGYPLNAFLSTMSADDLRLVDGQDAPAGFANQVAGSLLAVVVSVFDDETFLVWDAVN